VSKILCCSKYSRQGPFWIAKNKELIRELIVHPGSQLFIHGNQLCPLVRDLSLYELLCTRPHLEKKGKGNYEMDCYALI